MSNTVFPLLLDCFYRWSVESGMPGTRATVVSSWIVSPLQGQEKPHWCVPLSWSNMAGSIIILCTTAPSLCLVIWPIQTLYHPVHSHSRGEDRTRWLSLFSRHVICSVPVSICFWHWQGGLCCCRCCCSVLFRKPENYYRDIPGTMICFLLLWMQCVEYLRDAISSVSQCSLTHASRCIWWPCRICPVTLLALAQ